MVSSQSYKNNMILIAYGTRPEVIKLFPIIRAFKEKNIQFKTLFTGQHTDLYEDVKDLVPAPDFTIYFQNKHTLGERFSEICRETEFVFQNNSFSFLIVQGDTLTSLALAQIAFLNGIPVAHIEAGLRTFDLKSPFPEEFNRVLISNFANVNFAPTAKAVQNLTNCGARNIIQTGNTIVDAVRLIANEKKFRTCSSRKVLVTLHRRENHHQIHDLFEQINEIALELSDIEFLLPIHPNPNVKKHVNILNAINVKITEPLTYYSLLKVISECLFIISDSGGIQEEACCFKKKILIVRNTTERQETIDSGFGKLVGNNIKSGLPWALDLSINGTGKNPYGDGHASYKIANYFK